jgi:predicted PurR-regulated permease PerM
VALGLLVGAGFWCAYLLRDLLLVVVTAIVLASALEPAIIRVMRVGLSRVVATLLLYVSAFLFIAGLFYAFVPRLLHEASVLSTSFPTYLETLKIQNVDALAESDVSVVREIARVKEVLSVSGGLFATASAVFGGVLSFLLIVILSFYFSAEERSLDNFLRLVTPVKKHDYILDLWNRAQHKMGRWLQGQLLLSCIVGALVYPGLLLLGVPYALLLALCAGLFELVPLFGSILSAVPAVALAFLSGGTGVALAVIVLYLVVNQVQSNIIYPLVVQKTLGVSPVVVILAILAGGQIAGFLGILVAVPLVAALQEYVQDIQKGRRAHAENSKM